MPPNKSGDVIRFLYKNPNVWTIAELSQRYGCSRDLAGRVLSMLADSTNWVDRLGVGTYMIRPPEYPQSEAQPAPAPAPAPVAEPLPVAAPMLPEWEEMIPDDEDLYPPFKIRIYDHFRSKRGEKMFRVKDETGRRGIFFWVDDE